MGKPQDAKILEVVSRKLNEAKTLLKNNGYDDWDENLFHMAAEIDEEAKSLND